MCLALFMILIFFFLLPISNLTLFPVFSPHCCDLCLFFLCLLKAWVRASTWIPIFDVDNKLDFGTVPRKVTNFVMGIKNPVLTLSLVILC